LGLIEVYRALGGGWQIRTDAAAEPFAAPLPPDDDNKQLPAEDVPTPPAEPAKS